MDKFIAVIDYGLGNLRSISKALEAVGANVMVTNKSEDIANACAIVLPGVGAFYRGMQNIKNLGLSEAILKSIQNNKPFLGICLGLQLLFTESEEHGICKGLDIIKGNVRKFSINGKIPHMGWNEVRPKTIDHRPETINLFRGISDNSYFYFVHSYYVQPEDEKTVIATTFYGSEFASIVNKGNIWGVQFHPEKSSDLGLKMLKNFVDLTE
jgi:glutamine amidotransferase